MILNNKKDNKLNFHQKVILNNVNPEDVIRSFHDYNFVQFLTFAQPVRIEKWDGIDSNKKASFSFWFFGWKRIVVIHKKYEVTKNELHFQDIGVQLPFDLFSWRHAHIVEPYGNGSVIIDDVVMDNSSILKKYFICPLMIFPVFIRRITYRIWFYYLRPKHY